MLTQQMKDTVEKQRLGFVASVSEAGEPNVSPKGTFVVVDDQTLAFGDIRSPGTVANLRRSPAVEVNFVDPIRRKGFRAKGSASMAATAKPTRRTGRGSIAGVRWRTASNTSS